MRIFYEKDNWERGNTVHETVGTGLTARWELGFRSRMFELMLWLVKKEIIRIQKLE